MAGMYTTAEWIAKDGHEQELVEAWNEFATWAHSMPGAGTLRLTRDLDDATRFISFGVWDSVEAAHQWKSDPEFRTRMAEVQQHVAKFSPSELDLVRTVGDDQS